MAENLIWIPLLPFLGFLVNGLLGRRLGDRFASVVGCTAPIGAFLVAVDSWSALRETGAALHQHLFTWIAVEGSFEAAFALLFDPISCVMCLVVTGVGSLIHLYSIQYMRGDSGYARYFAYLNLFTAFMLILVLADNLVLLFVGWEGVGLCSYLLIGFWHEDPANCDAGRKAFIVNRIGDFGFLLGMFLLFLVFGTLELSGITDPAAIAAASGEELALWGWIPGGPVGALTAGTLLLFIGATGKSAQIPLYVWLPDAMAGPTPVSALIHAATMVTSGVYLCCRLSPLFSAAPTTLMVITVIAGATAIVAALIAFAQNDIKKVLAYSTVSQLGYMFFAVGVGAYGAALFHLVTHAFFKALLFLGAGSVIHALHHEQDMRRMGGLRRSLPFTHIVFLIGTLAIAGVPPLAGFFSKDEILFAGFENAFGHGGSGLVALFWGISFLTAGLTAFYMLRAVALTFWGESRVQRELLPKVHEPGGWIGLALFMLAILSILGGFLGVPEILGGHNVIGHFTGLHVDLSGLGTEELSTLHGLEWLSMGLSLIIATAGLAVAFLLYGSQQGLRRRIVEGNPIGRRLKTWSENKFYVDELYTAIVVAPFQFLAYLLWILVDRLIIDGLMVSGTALLTRTFGEFFRRMQSGFVPAYLLTFSCGALILLFLMLAWLNGAG
ncbi:MAG: NADH-quinone oxidoreductase subunit L [Planctomycetota bacterium]